MSVWVYLCAFSVQFPYFGCVAAACDANAVLFLALLIKDDVMCVIECESVFDLTTYVTNIGVFIQSWSMCRCLRCLFLYRGILAILAGRHD